METDRPTPGPLSGIRILDMTSVVMGPYLTQVLGGYGADIIKIEAPSGDTTRQITPMRNASMGSIFLQLNRQKRSIVLDLKQRAAVEAFERLAETADVILTNVRPQALSRLGITWENLSARNPRLIFVSLVGYGSDGPYAGQPTYEDLIQGLTAVPTLLMSAGSAHPHYVPSAFNDRGAGLFAGVALLAAIIDRGRTGRGQLIEIPMFETMAHATLSDHMGGAVFEPRIGEMGYKRILTAERRPYRTSDGYICVIIYTDRHWRSYLRLVGREHLMDEDPRLKSISSRTDHAGELYAYLSDLMVTKTTAEWLALMQSADLPAVPLHTLEGVLDDPHLQATGFFELVEHPTEGMIRTMKFPGRWSDFQPRIDREAPRLGEHSLEVLRECGLSPAEIERLIATKATVQAQP